MKQAERTPGPWTIEGPDQFGDYNIHHPADRLAIGAIVSNMRPAEEVAANARFIVEAVNAYTSTDALRSALAAYEKWEADLIGSNEAWYTREREPLELPRFTQALWDRLLEIQAMRNAALSGSPAPSTEGTPSASQLADMIPEWMAARLLRGERAIEASEFRQRDEIIAFGLARRAWPNETGDAWQTWLTPLGVEVRDLLAKRNAARTALAGS